MQPGPPTTSPAPPARPPLRPVSRRYRADLPLTEAALDTVRRCWDAAALPAPERAGALALLEWMCRSWGRTPLGGTAFRSTVAIDGSPFEPSIAWHGDDVELRCSIESLGAVPTAAAGQTAGWELTRLLGAEFGAQAGPCLALAELFTVPEPRGLFTIWHGVAWRAGAAPLFKVYLDPQAGGPERAGPVLDEAMRRLGVRTAWRRLADHVGGIGGPGRIPVGLALDLAGAASRVKVYLGHAGADAAAIDRYAAVARGHVPGAFTEVLRATAGEGPRWPKQPVTVYEMTAGAEAPANATLYIPVLPAAGNDAVARDRMSAFIRSVGGDPAPYAAFLETVADRPLGETALHNFVSYRPAPPGGRPRFAAYLAPGLFG
ncbi:tryptophan dimethylallyltransferase family protein [Marinactinospora rubrisoli]|uniref:Tryptophan dimethylallyltransferase family protein n=1 Tax=Marinactinospora rubrisoli TaxID=2715399 RepID=A0ABW2KFA7_9ACTN